MIDGQQRLTTLTTLLAAITSKVEDDTRTDFINYNRPGRPSQRLIPQPQLTLRDLEKEFFENYIQRLQFQDPFEIRSRRAGFVINEGEKGNFIGEIEFENVLTNFPELIKPLGYVPELYEVTAFPNKARLQELIIKN